MTLGHSSTPTTSVPNLAAAHLAAARAEHSLALCAIWASHGGWRKTSPARLSL